VNSAENHLRLLAAKCNHIANECADVEHFVPVNRLVARFRAKLVFRPLLVEGMLASAESEPVPSNSVSTHQWYLLIDSETYRITGDDLAHEKHGKPLPVRLRNTIAHELTHILAFRANEFGVEMPRSFKSAKTKREFVSLVEKQTEKLSPLLLLTDSFLDLLFAPTKAKTSLVDLCSAMRSTGVSRYVLINRLNLVAVSDTKRFWSRPSLNNLAVGIGEWVSEHEAVFKTWPLYSKFDPGRVPGFVSNLERGTPPALKSIFADPNFCLCGGTSHTTNSQVEAGTPMDPKSLRLEVSCSIELGSKRAGSEFLFVVQSDPLAPLHEHHFSPWLRKSHFR
jgi:hypothetical protein